MSGTLLRKINFNDIFKEVMQCDVLRHSFLNVLKTVKISIAFQWFWLRSFFFFFDVMICRDYT